MTQYIMDHLDMDEHAAHSLRQHYWRVYGATLKGLVRHHGINPHHFLSITHQLHDLPAMVLEIQRLRHSLQSLPGRKLVFTNAPLNYALRVLKLLGLEDIFETVFSVESSRFHPKPSVRGFRGLLRMVRARPVDCVMVEDNLPALMTAKRLGMKTVYVTRTLGKPIYVDRRISSVTELIRTKI